MFAVKAFMLHAFNIDKDDDIKEEVLNLFFPEGTNNAKQMFMHTL